MARRIVGVLVLIGIALALSTWTARAERLVGQYRGPTDKLTAVKETEDTSINNSGGSSDSGSSSGSTDSSSRSGDSGSSSSDGSGDAGGTVGGDSGGTTGGEGTGGSEPGGGEGTGGASPPPSSGDDGTGDTGGSATPDSGTSDRSPPPSSGGTTGGTSSGGVAGIGTSKPGTGPGGKKTDTSEGFKLWSFYWEHNREQLLHRLATSRRERVNFAPWGSSWVLGRGEKSFREVHPITQLVIREKILPVLVSSLDHKYAKVRDAAAIALGKLGGKDVVPLLIERALKDSDLDVREDATLALGLTREPEAYPTLMKILRGETAGKNAIGQRCFAAFALGLLGDAKASPEILEEMKNELRAHARESEPLVASMALAVGMLGDEGSVKELGGYLGRRNVPQLVQSYVASALGKLGHRDALKILTQAWRKADPMVRGSIALALGSFPETAIVKFLDSEGLKDGEGQNQNFSAISLARIGSALPVDAPSRKKVLVTLEENAEKVQRNRTLAQYSALGLGVLGEEGMVEAFREMAASKKYQDTTRSVMALSVGILGDSGSSKDLLEILKNRGQEPKFRSYAALGLAFLGDPKVIPELRETYDKAITRNNYDVMRGCVLGIGLLGDAGDVDWLIDSVLTQADDTTVRGAAAIAFGILRETSAVDKLVGVVNDREEASVEDKAFAVAALGYLADKDPYPQLSRVFENCNYRLEYPQLVTLLRIL